MSMARALCSAALVKVCVGAIAVITQDIRGAILVHESRRALERGACAFTVSACVKIIISANCGAALDFGCNCLQHVTKWRNICITRGRWVAACVPVVGCALEADTVQCFVAVFVVISFWAFECIAPAFFGTTDVEVRVCAILIFT